MQERVDLQLHSNFLEQLKDIHLPSSAFLFPMPASCIISNSKLAWKITVHGRLRTLRREIPEVYNIVPDVEKM